MDTFQEIIAPARSRVLAFASDTPEVFPEHWHTMAEFVCALRDSCVISVNREIYTLHPGEVLLIWPTELHATVSNPRQASILLQFNDDLITSCKDFDIAYHSLRKIHDLKAYSPSLNAVIASCLKEMYKVHQSRTEHFSEPKMLIRIYEMMIALCEHVQTDNANSAVPSGGADSNFYVIKKACSYINENYDRNLTQQEVAGYCGFSSWYFSKIFHAYTQESFPEFLTRKRLSAATRLLNSESISIAEAAYQSGFQSISNFNKVFRRMIGCTPLQYRKLYSPDDRALSLYPLP